MPQWRQDEIILDHPSNPDYFASYVHLQEHGNKGPENLLMQSLLNDGVGE